MNFHLAFPFGVVVGEAFQWSTWKRGHRDKPWSAYWKFPNAGDAHLVGNVTIVLLVGAAWWGGLLTWAMAKWTPIAALLSVSPPWEFMVAFTADTCGDRIAFAFRDSVGSLLAKLPSFRKSRRSSTDGEEVPRD